MAIISQQDIFSDAQAITATAASTNVLDIGAAGTPIGASAAVARDIGKANEIGVQVNVNQAFNNLTSLAVALQVSDDNSTFVEVATRTYLLAELTLGAMLNFPAELPVGTNKRYIRLNYTVTGTAPTTGKLTAAIVSGQQRWHGQ